MKLLITFFSLIILLQLPAQEKEKPILDIVHNVLSEVHNMTSITDKERKSFINYLGFIRKIEKSESIQGSVKFGFNGNEVDNSNLYTILTGMEANYGIFPLEINAKMDVQTQVSNGDFEENLSNLHLSMDYHLDKEMLLETYAFVARTKNKFLGIDQRYELGGGIIVNLYSGVLPKAKLTGKGEKLLKKLKAWQEKYPVETLNEIPIKQCLEDYCITKNILSKEEIKKLFEVQESHEKTLKKKYSKFRLGLLTGFNYEIERTKENLTLYNQDLDTPLNRTFDTTSLLRLTVAPKFEVQGDNFVWKNTLFFKIGLLNVVDNIILPDEDLTNIDIQDEKSDFWIDLRTSFSFKLTKKLSFVSSLNYVYDNAPKRIFFENSEGNFDIASAEDSFTGINFELKYTF